ncbi:MAG: hypothetical protein K2O18_02160 [Oscillospiraceae bacterium]|nr:hypothetical protein [Oscillospiraceae bacterium]
MNREFLASLGLDEQLIASVLEEHERDLSLLRQQCGAAEAALSDIQYDAAVQNAVRCGRFSSKAAERDFTAQLKNLNLEVKNGSLAGFDAFLEEQMRSDPDAFAAGHPVPKFVAPVGPGGHGQESVPGNIKQAREIGARRAAAMRSSGEILKNFL